MTDINMLNLIFLINISLFFMGCALIINNSQLKNNKIETTAIKQIVNVEEFKYFIPFILLKYYSHIINIRSKITPYLITTSYWYDNMAYVKNKALKVENVLIINLLKKTGLFLSLILYCSIIIFWLKYKRTVLGYQGLVNIGSTNGVWNLNLSLGLDGLSVPFVALIGFIFPIVYLSNWSTIDKLNIYYIILIISIELFLIIVFLVIDFIMFYVFFESILPPLFVLIGLYGAAQKFRAGYYFFLYTLLGSLFMLLTFVKMGGDIASSFFESYGNHNVFSSLQIIIWIILFFSLSVKTPLIPVHIWLPLAHSDANVSGSIILASIVLKLALYGFIRIIIAIFFLGTLKLTPFFLAFCSMSVIYSSLTTIRQFDLKVLVAYSSIAHMASSLLGTFSDTLYGLIGSIIFGLAHGFVSPGLFIVVGAILYDRCGSRIINYYRGLNVLLPLLALLFLLLTFGNMSVPLTGNFIGEFLSLLGTYQQNVFIATISAVSIVLSAVYSIFMFNRIIGGSISPYIHSIPDIFRKEFYILLPLILLTLLLGVYPYFISAEIEFGLSNLLFNGIGVFVSALGIIFLIKKEKSSFYAFNY
jgi:NADH-ubiquinone oxidoreductase chain 4